jgi:hypothetical protein
MAFEASSPRPSAASPAVLSHSAPSRTSLRDPWTPFLIDDRSLPGELLLVERDVMSDLRALVLRQQELERSEGDQCDLRNGSHTNVESDSHRLTIARISVCRLGHFDPMISD